MRIVSVTLTLSAILSASSCLALPVMAAERPLEARLMDEMMLEIGYPVRHCRTAVEGCEARLSAFAKYFRKAGRVYGIDPRLLAAIALHETALNPYAVGKIDEFGIMQLNPRRAWYSVPFRKKYVRRQCKRIVGACQGPVVMAASKWLRTGIDVCLDKQKALGWYSSGKCKRNSYSRRVLRKYRALND